MWGPWCCSTGGGAPNRTGPCASRACPGPPGWWGIGRTCAAPARSSLPGTGSGQKRGRWRAGEGGNAPGSQSVDSGRGGRGGGGGGGGGARRPSGRGGWGGGGGGGQHERRRTPPTTPMFRGGEPPIS